MIDVAWRELCASGRWVELMEAGEPYVDGAELEAAAERAFAALGPDDWREAFAAHSSIGSPRLGDLTGAREQAGMDGAGAELRTALAAAGLEYRRRFGYEFLIRARGRSGEEMLATLHRRLGNPAEVEFAHACAQQREITALRLADAIR